jgi:exodeoxyribonuclease VII large subunit
MDEARLSVAQFNQMLNLHVQSVGQLIVEGEITQISITARGGLSLSLKDPQNSATLKVSGYAPQVQGIKTVKEGMAVAIWGIPEIYEQYGSFSFRAYKILPVGEGALREAYEQLRRDLTREGLFATERKRELPEFIRHIALITAKNSAAESDFLKILRENRQGITIDFYPCSVQGKYAEPELISAVLQANTREYDCLIMIRGGGGLEDLIAFNDEKLARTIFASKIPVLAGVGHERDESIAELVADLRASTPSQAAYYIVSRNESFIRGLEFQLQGCSATITTRITELNRKIMQREQIIDSAATGLINLIRHRLRLGSDIISNRLASVLHRAAYESNSKLRLISQNFSAITATRHQKLGRAVMVLERFPAQVRLELERISEKQRLLLSYNPNNVLQRGYALVRNESGKVAGGIESFKVNENIEIAMKNGRIIAKIKNLLKN